MAQQAGFQKLTFRKGTILLEEGKPGESVFLITKGKVEIRMGFRRKNPQVLGVRGPGDIIGEISVVDDRPHMATALALEDVAAIAMSRTEFKSRVESMDPILRGTIFTLIKRMRDMADMLAAKADPIFWAP